MFAKRDLTQGSIPRGLLGFALPLILGNLLQQLYNLADTWVVGRFIGEGALAAVGSSYTLMTFLTSILLGLCMGSSVYFSIQYGRQDPDRLRNGIFQSFLLIGGLTLLLNLTVYLALDGILVLLQIPPDILGRQRNTCSGSSPAWSPPFCTIFLPIFSAPWGTPPPRWSFWGFPWF